jgi:hypothetical protein
MYKTYTKPIVTQVNLVPNEAVLSSCKTSLTGDAHNSVGYCGVGGMYGTCQLQGS